MKRRAFTLAEVLIVLMALGILAVLTMPTISSSLSNSQFKTAYKKGFTSIVSLLSVEKLEGSLPSANNAANAIKLWDILDSGMNVKNYLQQDLALNGAVPATTAIISSINDSGNKTAANRYKNWIITDDNVSYTVMLPNEFQTYMKTNKAVGGTTAAVTNTDPIAVDNAVCTYTKKQIAAAPSTQDALKRSCMIILVDVNGVASGPNNVVDNGAITADEKIPSVAQTDIFPIYVGTDGISAGPTRATITGHILAGIK